MSEIQVFKLPERELGKDPNDRRHDKTLLADIEQAAQEKSTRLFDWTEDFTLTREQAEAISEPEWVYENLIIQSHVIALVAEPNGGKTTIMRYVAGEMADDGYQVFYVNADTSGADAKPMVIEADMRGYKMMLPDMAGKSMEEVISHLAGMNESGGEFEKAVFILDTLKKAVDVISKSKAKELYKLFRSLTAKGMTIILLAHTNKYKDPDGKPVFEGTGDLRSDIDELIYLIPDKQSDGRMIVSTELDKVRGAFKPITFEISPEREVSQLERYVDTNTAIQQRIEEEKDAPVIEAIIEALQSGKAKQIEIIDSCHKHGISRRSVVPVLKRYRQDNLDGRKELWKREKGFERNTWNHELLGEIRSPVQGGISENW